MLITVIVAIKTLFMFVIDLRYIELSFISYYSVAFGYKLKLIDKKINKREIQYQLYGRNALRIK